MSSIAGPFEGTSGSASWEVWALGELSLSGCVGVGLCWVSGCEREGAGVCIVLVEEWEGTVLERRVEGVNGLDLGVALCAWKRWRAVRWSIPCMYSRSQEGIRFF